MTDEQLEVLRGHITRLRSAIDRAQAEHPKKDEISWAVERWPSNCCDVPFLFFRLFDLGYRGMIRKAADVSSLGRDFHKHVWTVLDGVTIDITADQFPGVTDTVIVSRRSTWHEALKAVEEGPWSSDGEAAYYQRHRGTQWFKVYAEILAQYMVMASERPREPYTIEDRGREIKIEALRNGYGRWFCFRCRQSGTTHHEPTPEDCERMAELHGRAHECVDTD